MPPALVSVVFAPTLAALPPAAATGGGAGFSAVTLLPDVLIAGGLLAVIAFLLLRLRSRSAGADAPSDGESARRFIEQVREDAAEPGSARSVAAGFGRSDGFGPSADEAERTVRTWDAFVRDSSEQLAWQRRGLESLLERVTAERHRLQALLNQMPGASISPAKAELAAAEPRPATAPTDAGWEASATAPVAEVDEWLQRYAILPPSQDDLAEPIGGAALAGFADAADAADADEADDRAWLDDSIRAELAELELVAGADPLAADLDAGLDPADEPEGAGESVSAAARRSFEDEPATASTTADREAEPIASVSPSSSSSGAGSSSDVVAKVHAMADEGRTSLEIARALDEQVGKVDLVLALRRDGGRRRRISA